MGTHYIFPNFFLGSEQETEARVRIMTTILLIRGKEGCLERSTKLFSDFVLCSNFLGGVK